METLRPHRGQDIREPDADPNQHEFSKFEIDEGRIMIPHDLSKYAGTQRAWRSLKPESLLDKGSAVHWPKGPHNRNNDKGLTCLFFSELVYSSFPAISPIFRRSYVRVSLPVRFHRSDSSPRVQRTRVNNEGRSERSETI